METDTVAPLLAPVNEAKTASLWRVAGRFAGLFVCGALFAAAFPSTNWSWLGYVGLIPLYAGVRRTRWQGAALGGLVWGYGWSLTSFYWLREIEPFIPFVMAFILALFPACWALPIPFLTKQCLVTPRAQHQGTEAVEAELRHDKFLPELLLVATLSAWWCVLEWTRSWIGTGLPWNLLAVSQWRNVSLIQICSYTGVYGVSFLLVFLNLSLFHGAVTFHRGFKAGTLRRPFLLYLALAALAACSLTGSKQLRTPKFDPAKDFELKALLVQGNIPQSRFQTDHAKLLDYLNVYIDLTRDELERTLSSPPDIIIWPETALPPAFRGYSALCAKYREEVFKLIVQYKTPLFFGTLDFQEFKDNGGERFEEYNSAMLVGRDRKVVDTYNKMHLVPWGEYTPWGKYYPNLKKRFGMGRDLTPGRRSTIFDLSADARAGALLCYEDIFPANARESARQGANMLVTLTNDAWYPTSDEPVQHLAQAVFRAVENRRVMIRAGNSSGTCVIQPTGVISDALHVRANQVTEIVTPTPETQGRKAGTFIIRAPREPALSFYTRHGDLFILACGVLFLLSCYWLTWNWKRSKELSLAAFEEEPHGATEKKAG